MQSSASQQLIDTPMEPPADLPPSAKLTEQELASLNGALSEVSAAVESTFLGASKRTMQAVRDLKQINLLVEQVSHPEGEALSQRIAGLALDPNAVRMDAESSGRQPRALADVATKVEAMCSELESLERCYQMFPVLRVLTQIHGSALKETSRDLDWFAGAIANESDRGTEVVGNLQVMITRQADRLKSAIRRTLELEQQVHGDLEASEGVLQRTAEQMQAIEQADAQALIKLQQSRHSISSATTELVSSMQFQDAFRQRTEHVQHALEQLGALVARKVLPGFDADRVLSDAEATTALTVLVSIVNDQAKSLASDLAREHEQLDQSLYALGEQTTALRNDLSATLRSAEHRQAVDAVEGQLRSYCTHVSALGRARRGREAITDSLQGSLAEMDADLMALEEVGDAIFLLAVNAVVLAARLGAEGRAIEQIAQQVRGNSTEAGAAIRLVRRLTEELRSLCGGATDADESADDRTDHGTDMRAMEQALREQATALMVALDTRSEQGDEVVGFCQNVISGFQGTRDGFAALRECMRRLSQSAAAWSAVAERHSLDTGLHPDLVRSLADYFNAHYTMESERITQGLALMMGQAEYGTEDSSPETGGGAGGQDAEDDDLSDILF